MGGQLYYQRSACRSFGVIWSYAHCSCADIRFILLAEGFKHLVTGASLKLLVGV